MDKGKNEVEYRENVEENPCFDSISENGMYENLYFDPEDENEAKVCGEDIGNLHSNSRSEKMKDFCNWRRCRRHTLGFKT